MDSFPATEQAGLRGRTDLDKLHPTVRGYQVWADGLKPLFTELLDPPAGARQSFVFS